MPDTQSRLREEFSPVTIFFGTILAVNAEAYTVDVGTHWPGQVHKGIGYISQYVHHNSGEGNYCIPEVGANCFVCTPSDHNPPFVLGFLPPFGLDAGHVGNRLDLKAGDQAIVSRELNGIIIRRGGVTQVSASPICQRIYTPIANTIRDVCENYELNTGAGQLRWFVRRSTPVEEAKSPSEFVLEAKEFAQDEAKVIVRLGSVEIPPPAPAKGPRIPGAIKIVMDVEVVGAFRYKVNLNGDSLQVQEGLRSLQIKGDDIYFVDGDREFEVKGSETHKITGSSTRTYGSEDVKVKGVSKEKVTTKKVILAPMIFLGAEAGAVPTLKGPVTLSWMATHFHPTPAGPSGPAVQATQLQPPMNKQFLTENLKVK